MPSLPHISGNVLLFASLAMLGWSGLAFGQDKDAAPTARQTQFFNEEVKPLLEAHCFKCHGATKKVKGGLSIRNRADLLEGGDSGPAASLKQADKSLLLEAISFTNEDLQMPPKNKLGKEEVAVLTQWVKMGLPWPDGVKLVQRDITVIDAKARSYWAYQPVKRPATPKVRNRDQVANPIDAFLLAQLEPKGLKLSNRAGKIALVRRAYHNLIGLPPTPQQVEAFLADKSPRAWENLIDKLLQSPQYGEKWARHWLDLVRYAETNGYERDSKKPFAWRYRDYIIRSFNDDKPYDRFITEQIAGDELEDGGIDGLIATGYYRLGIWNDEPADRTLHKYDVLDGIVSTTSQVVMGMTMGCARCHGHKKDPIPHKDYYRMLAFFQDVSNMSKNPTRTVASDEIKRQNALKAQKKIEFEKNLNKQMATILKEFKLAVSKADLTAASAPTESLLNDSRMTGQTWSYTFAKPAADWIKPNFNDRTWKTGQGGFGRRGTPGSIVRTNWHSSDIWMRRKFNVKSIPRTLTLSLLHDEDARIYINGTLVYQVKGHTTTYRSEALGAQALRALKPGENVIAVQCHQTTGGQSIDVGLNVVSKKAKDQLASSIRARGPKLIGKQKVDQYFKLKKQLDTSRRQKPPEAGVKVMCVTESGRSKTYVFGRGNPTMVGDEVKPGFPSVLGFADPAIPNTRTKAGTSGKRLILAKWLTNKKNPLTARALVNRLWQYHFGRGIVATSNDFGKLGIPPTHPKLLDYLAAEFMAQGWSIKKMQKLIMMSHAYQMSSADNAAAMAKDPANMLLWRFNMRRLTAEEIRDSILQVNGSINLDMYGPSIYTEVPKEILHSASRPNAAWGNSPPEQRTRRSIYIFIKRSLIEPILGTFDLADTDSSCAVRFTTTVPTQSLTMLNSKFFNDQAHLLAVRLKKEAGSDPAKQVQLALNLVTARKPSAGEVRQGVEFMKQLQAEDGLDADKALDHFCLIALNLNEFLYLD